MPGHAAGIEDILSVMPRAALIELSELLGWRRDGLHARAEPRGTALSRKHKASSRRAG